jgi:hypothetical protein
MFANKNTIQIGTPYYNFALRGPNYSHLSYVPQIYISRVDSNTIEIIVYINERNYKTKSFITRQIITYKEKLSNVEDYFRSVQNSNFKFALPNSLLFLEKVIKAIQSLVIPPLGINTKSTTTPPSITATPTTTSSSPIYFGAYPSGLDPNITSFLVLAYKENLAVNGTFKVIDGSAYISNVTINSVTITPVSTNVLTTKFTFTDSSSATVSNGYILWQQTQVYPVYPNQFTISIYDAGSVVFYLDYSSSIIAALNTNLSPETQPYQVTQGPAVITSQGSYYACSNLNLCTVDQCVTSSTFQYNFTNGSSIMFKVQYVFGNLPFLTS